MFIIKIIDFARSIKDEKEYGFDFDLFAHIYADECYATTERDYVILFLKKKTNAIWLRLLSQVNKVIKRSFYW